jgi:hypothetical protein
MTSPDHGSVATDPVPTGHPTGDLLVRWALAVPGMAGIGWGLLLLITRVRIPDWFRLARWGAAGIIVNDALIAPAAMVIGALLLRRVPVGYRWPLRSGLLAAGCLSIMILIAAGARRYRQNPTVVPTDPTSAATIGVIALVIIIAAVEAVLIIIRRRRDHDRAVDR